MWKFLVILLSAFACSSSFRVVQPEDEVLTTYQRARSQLTPEQEEFLTELLAADDALIAAATGRGIVDDVLQSLAGIGMGTVNVNLVGGANPGQPASVLNPTFTLMANAQQPARNMPLNIAPQQAPVANVPTYLQQGGVNPAGAAIPAQGGTTTTVGGNNNHLFSTISSVIRNSNTRNVTGIVDQSLRIATPAPIREFVTGILGVVYCNGIRRLLGRC